MAAAAERIVNRSSARPWLPAGLWSPTLLFLPLFGLVAAMYFVNPASELHWFGWFYLGVALVYLLTAWSASIAWIEVGPERIVVQRTLRSHTLPMSDVARIDAHRHWHSFLAKEKPPAYWFLIQRTTGWPWRFFHIQPEAGDRVLAAIHRLRKPIQVFNWN